MAVEQNVLLFTVTSSCQLSTRLESAVPRQQLSIWNSIQVEVTRNIACQIALRAGQSGQLKDKDITASENYKRRSPGYYRH